MRKSVLEKAATILNKCNLVTIVSDKENRYPRLSLLTNNQDNGISTIWVATWTNAAEPADFLESPTASLFYHCDGNSVNLTGKIQLVWDSDIKKAMWQERYIQYFPLGLEDPKYCVLKFDTREVSCWIDDSFETLQL